MQRMGHVDALRGIAAVFVVFYHYFGGSLADDLPYGSDYAHFWLIKNGHAGVKLFFMISGFVILMSLERTSSLPTFLYKRWLRLFPAMLIASVLIFAVRSADRVFVNDAPALHDFLSGLLFIPPSLLNVVSFHFLEFAPLDDVFWTLYTEASFYLLFGALYFRLGRAKAVSAIVMIAIVLNLGPLMLNMLGAPAIALRAFEPFNLWFNWDMFGYFAAGALFYWSLETGSKPLYSIALIWSAGTLCLHLLTLDPSKNFVEESIVVMMVIGLFSLAVSNPLVQSFLDRPLLRFLGFISYPLYLLHCSIGIIEIHALHWLIPNLHPIWLGMAAFLTMTGASYYVAKHGEAAVRQRVIDIVAALGAFGRLGKRSVGA